MAKTHTATATFTTNTTQDFDVSAYDTAWVTAVLSGSSGALAATITSSGSGAKGATTGFVNLASGLSLSETAPATDTAGQQLDLRGVRTLRITSSSVSGTGASVAVTVGQHLP